MADKTETLNVGDEAPEFKLRSTGNTECKLSDQRGKNVVLNFFPAAFSGVCSQQMTNIEAEKGRFGDDTVVVGISVEFGWFLPRMGDSEAIGPPTRPATLDYLVDVAKAAEDVGFSFALVPVGTTCQDAWLVSAVVAGRTEKLKFLVAMRPGFVAP